MIKKNPSDTKIVTKNVGSLRLPSLAIEADISNFHKVQSALVKISILSIFPLNRFRLEST